MNTQLKLHVLAIVVAIGALWSTAGHAQVKIGDNLGTHKATRSLDLNANNIDAVGSLTLGTLSISLSTNSGAISSTAATTVDKYSAFAVSVSVANGNFTLPAPTVTTAGRIVNVINAGSNSFTMYGVSIGVGQYASFVYTGSAWVPASAQVSGVSLSSLTAATATNTIDNLAFAQTWNWSTATTTNPLSVNAAALTTGSLLNLTGNALTTGNLITATTTSNGLTSTNGLLYVANLGSSTNSTVATIQANSTAGSGLSVLANGNVGIGTKTPGATFQNTGSTIIGGMVSLADISSSTTIGASAAATVDANAVIAVAQSTSGQTLSLYDPTVRTAGRIVTVINTGSAAFNIAGTTVSAGTAVSLIWNGSLWVSNGGGGVSGKQTVAIPNSSFDSFFATTDNGGSANVSYTITLTVAGLVADDAVTVNFASSDYNTSKWLAANNEGMTILSSVASGANTVSITLANLKTGTQPTLNGLRFVVAYRR